MASASVHDLKALVLSFHSLIAIETVEEERVRAILRSVATDLRLPMFEWSVTTGFSRILGTPVGETEEPLAVLRHMNELTADEAIFLLKDFAPHLGNATVARALRELAQKMTNSRSAIVLTGDPLELPRDLETLAVRVELELPGERELRALVRQVVEALTPRQRVDIDLTREQAQQLVGSLSGLTLHQARRVVAQAIVEDGRLTVTDIDKVIRWKGEIIEGGGVLEFIPPEANHSELGGFENLKRWLDRSRTGFTPEARAMNLAPPKGLLLAGVQGCGKSLAAKFVAKSWKLPLLKLDAGRLYDKYVGESERNFRRATLIAEAMAPVVLWIDEIEKAFASGGSADVDGGLSQRLFASFLTWLQEKKQGVFVVGAANDLTRLPPELLRKGRFDEIFFVDLPNRSERATILSIHLRLRKQDAAAIDLDPVVEATEGFSGAELEQAVISALYRALHEREALTATRLLEAVQSTVPLSRSRREDVERTRAFAAARFTPVA
ncbi:MAG: AAA family ATPase [Thermoanaerobaculia bacterium]